MPIARRGLLFVLSSPSGAGKTTLSRSLLKTEPELLMSVSVTTRPARPDEVDGRDYHFKDGATFDQLLADGQFLEWAHVFQNRYGTLRAPVEAALASGCDVLFDIDWQGARQLAGALPDDLVRVFILPPSGIELEARLRGRAQDPHDVVAKRMAAATAELSHWNEYDYIVVNDDLAHSLSSLRAILAAERLRRTRQNGLKLFVSGIEAELS